MMERLEQVDRPFHVHLLLPKEMLMDNSLAEELRAVGRKLRESIALVVSSIDERSPLLPAFQIANSTTPQMYAASTETIRKYMAESLTMDNLNYEYLIDFCQNVTNGKAKRIFASAPVPDEKVVDGITVVVRDTVTEIAEDPTKDVLVHVYHPDDEESEAFTTDYENLAIALENITSLVLAKFDASANEHEKIDFTYEDLPAMLLFPAKKGSDPISMDISTAFVHSNAAIKFDLPDLTEYKTESSDYEEEDEEDDDDEEEEIHYQDHSQQHDEL
eukprot:jgi/Picsp_1/1716/NSC_05189-R2_rad2 family